MKFSLILALSLIAVGCANQSTNNTEEKKHNNQQDFEKALSFCQTELEATAAGLKMRESGKTKEFLATGLPPRAQANTALGITMWSVLDDIYDFPEINSFTYFSYRSEVCARKYMGSPVPSNYAKVAPLILNCQKRFALQSDSHITCVRESVIKATD